MTGSGTVQVPSFSGYGGATLHLAIDPAEHQRRQAAGIGPVTGHGFGGLDHLMALPAGMPVPVDSLTREQQKYVRRAPAAICTIEDGQVTRHAIRPCRVALATVHSPSACKTALESASRFAPFCARRVVIRRRTHWPESLTEFDFYGIGVSFENGDGTLETLVEPEPWIPKRHTPVAWWFAERAYAAYLEHAATNPAGAAA
ncbi:hypothetical protein [Streptomyces himastatinicus]|uniref:hypothetical protein n=1 Tax=Streptomyces himastatinicus TaxID=998084 RepID=UPI0001B4FC5F|nr:hypothetical protein [Streptomyces himastatinicus]